MPKTSRAAAKRFAANARTQHTNPTPLPDKLRTYLDNYTPDRLDHTRWAAVRAVHRAVMERSKLRGEESFKKRVAELAAYLVWRHEHGLSIGIADAMTYSAIDDHYRLGCSQLGENSRNDRRSRLRKLAEAANPGLEAATRAVPLGHQPIKPGYTPRDEAAIQRAALRQRRPASRRALCIVVGLCAGAGLDSVDLRYLLCRHIDDRGDAGIVVHVPGPRARRVMVRRDYELLVRVGLDGLRPNDLVIGRDLSRRNLVGGLVERAELLGDLPHIEASRLRSTWLTWLMTRTVPLNVILDAAGLKTARSLVDLLPHMPTQPTDDQTLRGEESR